jgi:hypothetical protein
MNSSLFSPSLPRSPPLTCYRLPASFSSLHRRRLAHDAAAGNVLGITGVVDGGAELDNRIVNLDRVSWRRPWQAEIDFLKANVVADGEMDFKGHARVVSGNTLIASADVPVPCQYDDVDGEVVGCLDLVEVVCDWEAGGGDGFWGGDVLEGDGCSGEGVSIEGEDEGRGEESLQVEVAGSYWDCDIGVVDNVCGRGAVF